MNAPIVTPEKLNIVFNPKKDENGYYFTEVNSGFGFFNDFFVAEFGKPTQQNYKEIACNWINSTPVRREVFNQYVNIHLYKKSTQNI